MLMKTVRCATVIGAVAMASAARAGTSASRGAPLTCGASGADPVSTAVLIGGIHDSWRSLESWIPLHTGAGRTVCGYTFDYRRRSMASGAAGLEHALEDLAASGTRRLFITAFSMGGWIAKAAVDAMVRNGGIHRFERVELVALGTPWGGFSRADPLWHLRWFPTPGLARALARVIRRPMAFEVGAASAFIRARQAALPRHVNFIVCDGGADRTAGPRTTRERVNYDAVLSIATRRVSVPRATHDDLRVARAEVLTGPGQSAKREAER